MKEEILGFQDAQGAPEQNADAEYDRVAKIIEEEGIKEGDKFRIVLKTGHSTTEATFESMDKTKIYFTGRSGQDTVKGHYEISPIKEIEKLESN